VREERSNYWGAAFESALDWWQLAGADVCVEDTPRNWLKRPTATPPAASSGIEVAASGQGALPATLDLLNAWLMKPDNLPAFGARRVASSGTTAAHVMVLGDMPDVEDMASGSLFSGASGRLLQAMLSAIGLDIADVHVASLAPARPASGRIPASIENELGRIARHRAALVDPRLVLLLGDATVRVLAGMSLSDARGREHSLNHDGGNVSAIATFHPRFLLQQPARKADAWADLRMVLEIMKP
jgi:DNA polymerase